MKLVVLLVVLGLRQTELGNEMTRVIVRQARRWRDGWLERGAKEGWHGAVVLGLIALPPVLLVLAAAIALHGVLYNLLLSVLSLMVMLAVLLDRELPAVDKREQEAWLAADEASRDLLVQADPMVLQQAASAELERARRAVLAAQFHELFAPLFWFLLLGPVAGLAYYVLRLAAEGRTSAATALAARLLHYADWPVARVLSLSFALAGDFVATWQHWRAHALNADIAAVALLDESAQAAQPVVATLSPETLPGPVLVNALSMVVALLHRALVIWVVLLALHTLWP